MGRADPGRPGDEPEVGGPRQRGRAGGRVGERGADGNGAEARRRRWRRTPRPQPSRRRGRGRGGGAGKAETVARPRRSRSDAASRSPPAAKPSQEASRRRSRDEEAARPKKKPARSQAEAEAQEPGTRPRPKKRKKSQAVLATAGEPGGTGSQVAGGPRRGDPDEDGRSRRPRAGCAGACGSRAACGCPCGGCTTRTRRRCSPRPTRRRGCAGSRGRRSARASRMPQYWQRQPSRASTALRVIRRRWMSRGTRTKLTRRITSGGVEPHRLRAQDPVAALEHLGLLLQDQDQGAADGADVERLVGGVEDEDAAAREPAACSAGCERRWLRRPFPAAAAVRMMRRF